MRMALILVILDTLTPMVDQWSSYKELLKQFYAANEEKHVAVLSSVIGGLHIGASTYTNNACMTNSR